MSPRPLDGYKVLDFSTLLPGPLATLILAEAGADVLKLERPGRGEDMRQYPPMWGSESVSFGLLNRGKKSLAVDLKSDAEKAALQPLIRETDILVEQFRPGVMQRLGLGYEAVKAVNPRLIYCSITGYGATGPKANMAGHDLNYIGDTGLLSLSMGSAAQPVLPPALIADIAGGTYPAVVNILLALLRRERTGQGAHLDIAMCDNLFSLMYWAIGAGLATGEWPKNGAELVTGGSPRYQIYPTSDGKFVAAAPLEQKFWETFCGLIGVGRNADIATVRDTIARHTAAHWKRLLEGQDCCCSIVASLQEALTDPHFKARGLFDHTLVSAAGTRISALPVPVAPQFRASSDVALAAPALDEHRDPVPD